RCELDGFNSGRNVLGKVGYFHRFQFRRVACGGSECRLPLQEARWRRGSARALGRCDRGGPGAPVLSRPVQVAGTCGYHNASTISFRGESHPSPKRKHAGVEHIALDVAFIFQLGSDFEDLADIASRGVSFPVEAGAKAGDLRGRSGDQNGVQVVLVQAIDGALIARANQGATLRIEAQGIYKILRVRPDFLGPAVGVDAVNLGAAGNGSSRRSERRWRSS